MSDVIAGFNVGRAVKHNAKACTKLGWLSAIPVDAIAAFPDLVRSPLSSGDAEALAVAVSEYQSAFGLIADGKLGRGTWMNILKRFDFIETAGEYFMFKQRRRALAQRPPYKLYSYDEPGGRDLHPGGDFTSFKRLTGKRERRIKRILLHWGGVDAKSCKNALFNRDLSSHFGIELGVAFQWLDIAHKAWHASWGNTDTIGIDLCQQPTLKHFGRYKSKGYDVFKARNPAKRPNGQRIGDKVIVTLDSRTAETTRELCRDLCAAFDIPFDLPRDENGAISHRLMSKSEFMGFEGILAHHHISKGKWDIAPWISQIFDHGFEHERISTG